MNALKALTANDVTVIRDGLESTVDVKELVVGDIVKVHAGNLNICLTIWYDSIHRWKSPCWSSNFDLKWFES